MIQPIQCIAKDIVFECILPMHLNRTVREILRND